MRRGILTIATRGSKEIGTRRRWSGKGKDDSDKDSKIDIYKVKRQV